MDGLLQLVAQGIALADPGEAPALLLTDGLLFLRLLHFLRAAAKGRHLPEEVIKEILPEEAVPVAIQGRPLAEEVSQQTPAEEAVFQEAVHAAHHAPLLGQDAVGIAQLPGALLTEMLLLPLTVDIALVNEAHFILAAIVALHNPIPPSIAKLF